MIGNLSGHHKHPNWAFALGLLDAVLPGYTDFSPDRTTGHTPADWHPFDLEERDMDEIEDDLLSRCVDMTGPLVVVNDPSFYADRGVQHGPFFVDASGLRDFVKSFSDRATSYFMDGHVTILSPVTGIVVMVMDDQVIARIQGQPVMRMLPGGTYEP